MSESKIPTGRFRSIDTLRGLAAVVVAYYHCGGGAHGLAGYIAVDFFLVLSGFVLTHSYLYKERSIGIGGFIVRRFARLWPLHVFSLFVMWWVIWAPLNPGTPFDGYGGRNNLNTLLQNLTLTHNLGLPPSGPGGLTWNFPSWSISVEFWVNVLFILFIRKTTRSWVLALISVGALWLILHQSGSLDTYNRNYFGWLNSSLLRGVASFTLGILAYRLYIGRRERAVSAAWATGEEALFLCGAVYFLFAKHMGHAQMEVAAPLFFTLMVPVFAWERGHISRVLRPGEHLGTISYSVYLNHMGMWILVNSVLFTAWCPHTLILPIWLVITLIYSHFTYRWVEKPAQRAILRAFAARSRAA